MANNWGSYVQGGNDWELLDKCGTELSIQLSCTVHYPAYNKRLFECQCGITIPRWAVEAAIQTDNWADIIALHNKGPWKND